MAMQYQDTIYIVLVTYKVDIKHSVSFNSLLGNIQHSGLDYELLIYNNSVDRKVELSNDYTVYNSPVNSMLAGAYNYALEQAVLKGRKWLLLLDQDTYLTTDYFLKIQQFFKTEGRMDNTVCAVPILRSCKEYLSPMKNRSAANVWWFQKKIKQPGYAKGYMTAFNSAALLRVDFMNSIGGFSGKYPLDRLDYWYFYKIYEAGKKTYVLDTVIEHDLSVTDYDKYMTLIRYKSILAAELAFAKERGFFSVFLYKILLFFRFFKQLFFIRSKQYAYSTFTQLFK